MFVEEEGRRGTLVVGAPLDSRGSSDSDYGAAYVFDFVSPFYRETAKLTASDSGNHDLFGQAVAVNPAGDRIAVTAIYNDIDDRDAGAAYTVRYSNAGWSELQRLDVSDLSDRSAFGAWVSLSDDTVVVAAPGALDDSGAAYVFLWPLFADGFESGACDLWSSEIP
jgi:hypothetical protein